MRILVAEDDETSRIVLVTLLRKWGHEVVSTSDGDQAWSALQVEDAPHLAILDWMMPGMDGTQICREARKMSKASPLYIILLTALEKKENIVTGLDAGADDYVTKPFNNDELRARIRVAERMLELQYALSSRIDELNTALSEINTLQGILPICMHCHKIRSDEKSWQKLEDYLQAHSDAEFSHSLCDECLEKHYPKPAQNEVDKDFEELKELIDKTGDDSNT